MKPLKIDWDALEEAFNSQSEELVYYLDLVTGHVVLEGEGEDDPSPEDDESLEPAMAAVPRSSRDSTRAYIDPPDELLKLEWLQAFVSDSSGLGPDQLRQLTDALEDDDPAEAVREVLGQHREVRDRWYVYRADRVHEMIDQWLAEHSIAIASPPPWKG